ncbi:hypothetical protein ACJMK2_007598 [Sinanodonta woodiana]|uniref:Peroxisome biogenesis factor 2 n=1 Tax=Sinanodonta woodiana TaxID=1069815 RepID=A0ABD3VJ11_SINWO
MAESGQVFPALRVSQLDASELDHEVFSLTKSQFTKIFKYHQTNFLARFAPEIDAALKLLIWKFTVHASESTVGQQILNLKYHDERSFGSGSSPWMSKRQKILYAMILIGCPWIKDRSNDLMQLLELTHWRHMVNQMLGWFECSLKVASLVNFLVFLRKGVYLSLMERILGIRAMFPQEQGMRQVTFEYMTRELLWHGFSEFLFFILPLINFQRLKNFVMRRLLPKSLLSRGLNDGFQRTLTSCAICGEWPINPREIGCRHVFCYFCIQSNFHADPAFTCPLCNQSVGDSSNITAIKVNLT